MLEVCNLKKSYGDFLIDVSFKVDSGETLVIAGHSGCGKTTIINLILGITEPNSGEIKIDGKNVLDLPPWKRNMAVVFQNDSLFPHLNASENIEFGLKMRKILKKERKETVRAMLKLMNMEDYGLRRIETLSGGERQRIALARALAIKPSALLLDEPFSGLDRPLRNILLEELNAVRAHSAAPWIVVTHSRTEAKIMAERGGRIALINKGKIITEGSANEVLTHSFFR